MKITGKVLTFGDDVNTDVITSGNSSNALNDQARARKVLSVVDADFGSKAAGGGIVLVAGRNFGCGSSRENAATMIKEAGVVAIIAESFGHIFYRNAINNALPALVCPGANELVKDGDETEIDTVTGKVLNSNTGTAMQGRPVPEHLRVILESGGLIAYTLASHRP